MLSSMEEDRHVLFYPSSPFSKTFSIRFFYHNRNWQRGQDVGTIIVPIKRNFPNFGREVCKG
ncbi:hypothetical protein AGR8A_Cc40071 [Agrobacterium fabrum str. J-07]|nr:hypothetical protein AGR8A_Cc40071 [Agrobacterium fabrum str. J-07]